MAQLFYRVIASKTDVMETKILEETNKKDIIEAVDFIKAHPHEGATWVLTPMEFEHGMWVSTSKTVLCRFKQICV